jgi:hypothetical protein
MEGQLAASITNLLVIARNVAISIAALMFLVAGYQALTSAGDPGAMAAAKSTARNATVGLVVIFGSTIIANALAGAVRMGG